MIGPSGRELSVITSSRADGRASSAGIIDAVAIEPRGRSTADLDILLALELRRGRLRHDLLATLRGAVQDGRLTAGTRLPASRQLAGRLGVSRGVVADTYEQLAAEGYLRVRARQAPVVARVIAPSAAVPAAARSEPERERSRFHFDFVATTPDVELFPRREWARALEAALRGATNDALDYGDHRGRIELRTALAGYLGRVRGVRVTPDRILVSQGFTQALALVCQVLRARGARDLWFESPSLAEEWATVIGSGLRVRPIPIDHDGLRADLLPRRHGAAVVVTPAHQFPTGAVLSPERRNELVGWARRHDGLIVEDDYDAEFRYDRAAVGAVQGLDPDHVIHVGTASKTLAPGMRLGWLSLPAGLVADVRQAKAAADSGSPAIEQLALAGLLTRGDYDRQVVRTRNAYRARRDRLLAALASHVPELPVEGAAAGLHVLVRLPGIDDAALTRAAAEAGIGVRALSPMYLAETGRESGLVLGYGRLPVERIDDAVAALAAVMRTARPAAP
jgi:GntR family transcriptional regulator / MocR family aminotransferase